MDTSKLAQLAQQLPTVDEHRSPRLVERIREKLRPALKTPPRRRRPADNRPSARELFPVLREKLNRSRPVIEPAKNVSYIRTKGRRRGEAYEVGKAPVLGAPTFRNVIELDDKGKWRHL